MNLTYNNLRLLILYLGLLVFSIGIFYAVDGDFESDGWFSMPTIWVVWFYFLYLIIPFAVFIRLLFRLLIKRKHYTQSEKSIVFLIGLSVAHASYWLIANTNKNLLYQEVQELEVKIFNEINTMTLSNIKSIFELNKHNRKRSYKISFTVQEKPTYETTINIKEVLIGENEHASTRSFLLQPNKKNQARYFYISEEYFRNKATPKDVLDFKFSYTVDFPQETYKPRTKFAQQLCTWSIIECKKIGKEFALHNTELFDSTIFTLPYKINSLEKPLTKIKLSGFTNLDIPLTFTNISFLTEQTLLKDGLIKKFILKLQLNSRINGYVYSQISFAEHAEELLNFLTEHKSIIQKGKNIISIPVNINQLATLMDKQNQNGKIKFYLLISNNQNWYCPDSVCEIINKPPQLKNLVIKTKQEYRAENFPAMKPKKRIIYYPRNGQRGDFNPSR